MSPSGDIRSMSLGELLEECQALNVDLVEALYRSETLRSLRLQLEPEELRKIVVTEKAELHGPSLVLPFLAETEPSGLRDSATAKSFEKQARLQTDTGLQVSHEVEHAASAPVRRVSKQRSSRSSVQEKEKKPGGRPFLPTHGSCWQHRLYLVFDDAGGSWLGAITACCVVATILVSTGSFVMESMPKFRTRPSACELERTVENCEPRAFPVFASVETVCIMIFTVDYMVRVGFVHAVPDKHMSEKWRRTLKYAKQPLNVIDLLAILPWYINLVVGDIGPVRVLRLARILRLFKAAKHHPGILMLGEVMVMSGLPLLILVFFNCIITVLFGALIYFAEGLTFTVDPEYTAAHADGSPALYPRGVYVRPDQSLEGTEVSPFRSIPYSCYWVLTTMTTVGYGDLSPTSQVGKAIGVATFYVGVIFLALPISVIVTNFEIVYDRQVTVTRQSKRLTNGRMLRKMKTLSLAQLNPCLPAVDGVKRQLFLMLEDPSSCRLAKYYSVFVIAVIILSTCTFIMESMPEFKIVSDSCVVGSLSVDACEPQPYPWFYTLECACIIVFTMDYVFRMATVHAVMPYECGFSALEKWVDDDEDFTATLALKITFRYCAQALNTIDFLAILPFYVELAGGGGGGASVLRVLRLVRIFRVLKVPKMRACADMFLVVIEDALPALFLLLFMTALMSVLYASLIVFAEGSWYSLDHFTDEYPYGVYVRPTKDGYNVEVSPFKSILYAFWWFFATATTVGYGDDYPTTTMGRLVGIATFYTGIVLIALPITIIGGCFNKYYPDFVAEFEPPESEEDEDEDEEEEDDSFEGDTSGLDIGLESSADSLANAPVSAFKLPRVNSKIEDDLSVEDAECSPRAAWKGPTAVFD
eukprot:TRINITY_DN18991_c0_g1_i1.p1 TRINITY_DN18991_c0_g1~~TRINITY_DN18991_c0_g1_i1.p1  ORF type:complete len:898 (+),score=174.63 TRINITY_DN18991_c0_g1_i1:82-2694(+)